MFPRIGVPKNGWFIMENPVSKNRGTPKMPSFGVLLHAKNRKKSRLPGSFRTETMGPNLDALCVEPPNRCSHVIVPK